MTAGVTVSVPLNVDGLVGSHVDNLGLGLEMNLGLLGLGGSGNGSSGNIVVDIDLKGGNLGLSAVALFALGFGGLGRSRGLLLEGSGSGRGRGRDRRILLLARFLPGFRHGVGVGRVIEDVIVRRLRTAQVELHVLTRSASLGLAIIG